MKTCAMVFCSFVFIFGIGISSGSAQNDLEQYDEFYEEIDDSIVVEEEEAAESESELTPLEQEYGRDLRSAPFAIRYNFENDTEISWAEASLEEKSKYLKSWLKAEAAKNKEYEKFKRAEEKYAREKARAREQEEKAKLREKRLELQEKRAYEKYEAQRRRDFQKTVDEQKRRLREMQRSD